MKKLLAVVIASVGFASGNVFAEATMEYDFSNVKVSAQAKNVQDYPGYYLAWKAQVHGYIAGWNGIPFSDLQMSGQPILSGGNPDHEVDLLNIGITHNAGSSFDNVTPSSCIATLKEHHSYVLKVYGVINAPGAGQEPSIHDLHCKLIEK